MIPAYYIVWSSSLFTGQGLLVWLSIISSHV